MHARYQESGLTVDLCSVEHVRFEVLKSYRTLSGQHLKEIDFAFYTTHAVANTATLWLVELKQFIKTPSFPTKKDEQDYFEKQEQTLVKKVQDTLLMLSSAWLKVGQGQALCNELPTVLQHPQPMKIIIALDMPKQFESYFGTLQDSITLLTRAYIKLFDAKLLVCSYEDLITHFPTLIQR